jgi:hypothetical protein
MILDKLYKIEEKSRLSIKKEKERINTVKSMRRLLNQIDLSSEVIPVKDIKQLSMLIYSLKGKVLTEEEMNIINELI